MFVKYFFNIFYTTPQAAIIYDNPVLTKLRYPFTRHFLVRNKIEICSSANIKKCEVTTHEVCFGTTGGHFACACVNPLNDNSVGASNLMAGNRKLARKVTVLLKAISLVL